MTTNEKNRMIAEFMGLKPFEDSRYGTMYTHPSEVGSTFTLKYDTSWDWLMPVVEKINNIHIPETNTTYTVIIWKYDCHINDATEIIFECSNPVLINAVYDACVQFIQWYTTQQKEAGDE